MGKKVDVFPGDRYGRLTVVAEKQLPKGQPRRMICKCDCGTVKEIRLNSLRTGETKSCGCIFIETHNSELYPYIPKNPVTIICDECGKPFETGDSQRHFCSLRCATIAGERKHKITEGHHNQISRKRSNNDREIICINSDALKCCSSYGKIVAEKSTGGETIKDRIARLKNEGVIQ